MKLHYNLLKEFQKNYYSGFIGRQHLKEEIAIKNEKFWLAEYNKQKFLLNDQLVNDLPIVVLQYQPLLYKGKVYNVPIQYKTAYLKPERVFSFREIVDWFDLLMSRYDVDGKQYSENDYKKSLIHHLLYRIIVLTAEIDRINFRISTSAGFGKNSLTTMLNSLMNDVVEINPRSVPAIEYRLNNKIVVLDEMSNLESSQKQLIQNLLLQVGDFSPRYEKGARSTTDTSDVYDISHLSLLIFYNYYEYYVEANQEHKFFDKVFTKAVLDRFPAVRFKGTLDQKQFIPEPDVSEYQKYVDEYKAVVRSIRWYKKHWKEEASNIDDVMDNFRLYGNRHYKSIYKVVQFIKMYSRSDEEFLSLVKHFHEAYWAYKEAISGGNKSVVTFDEIKVSDLIKEL